MANGHGGPREGVQGQGYSQRTDLLANPSRVQPTPAAPTQAPVAAAPQMISPDQVPTLTAPTMRPNEPVGTGMVQGPGAQPDMLSGGDPTAITLRLLYGATGSEDIRRLLAAHESGTAR